MQNHSKINFKLRDPCPALKKFIQAYWFASTSEELEEIEEFKVLTDCASGLVLNYGDKLVQEIKTSKCSMDKEIVVLGPTKHLLRFQFEGRVNVIGVRFFVDTSYLFLKKDMSHYTDKIFVSSSDIEGLDSLFSILEKSTSEEESIEIMNEFFIKLLANNRNEKEIVHSIFDYIKTIKEPTVEIVAEEFKISLRELQRLFKKYVGIQPNVYFRAMKVTDIKNKIALDDFDTLTNLSHDEGYFDQSHFNREFKTFMDETPKKYHKLKKKIKE